MEYVVVMSTLEGDAIAVGDHSCIQSDTPVPVPNVGEKIYVPAGFGPDGGQGTFFEVLDRVFSYTSGAYTQGRVRVELFCQEAGGL